MSITEQAQEQPPRKQRRKPKHLRTNDETRKNPPHRPKTYTPEQAAAWQDEVCAWMMQGKSVAAFCKRKGYPTTTQIAVWRRESMCFAQAYARAREDGADAWADELIEIADGVKNCRDSAVVNAARLRVDTRKWVASKLKPKTYADRIEQFIGNVDGSPLQPSSAMIDDAVRARVLATLVTMKAIEGAQSLAALLAPVIDVTAETDGKVNLSTS